MAAPRGSRRVASEIARLVAEHGAEAVSRWMDVPLRSVERIASRAERGLSLGTVIRSREYLDRLARGLEEARSRAEALARERSEAGFRRVGPDRYSTPPLTPDVDQQLAQFVTPQVVQAVEDGRTAIVNRTPIVPSPPEGFRADLGGRTRPPLRYVDLADALRRVEDLRRAGVPQPVIVYDPVTDTWQVWKPDEDYELVEE